MNAVVPATRPSPVERFIADVLPPAKEKDVMGSLPEHVKPERFKRNLANALMREPKLLKCDPRVVFREVSKIAALGLLLDPQLGEAYLIADGRGDVQSRVGYRGLIKLARQSGEIASVYARDVCAFDRFHVVEGTNRSITHEPDYRSDRGAPAAYYAVFTLRDGTPDFEVMSVAEIHRIRDRSDAWRAYKAGKIKSTPWATDEGEMAKKTVLRRLLKRAPMSPELADLLGREDELDRRDMRDVSPPVAIVRNPLDDEPPPAIEDHGEADGYGLDDDTTESSPDASAGSPGDEAGEGSGDTTSPADPSPASQAGDAADRSREGDLPSPEDIAAHRQESPAYDLGWTHAFKQKRKEPAPRDDEWDDDEANDYALGFRHGKAARERDAAKEG